MEGDIIIICIPVILPECVSSLLHLGQTACLGHLEMCLFVGVIGIAKASVVCDKPA